MAKFGLSTDWKSAGYDTVIRLKAKDIYAPVYQDQESSKPFSF